MPEFMSVQGPQPAIQALTKELGSASGIEVSRAVALNSPADGLDAPIGPDEAKTYFEMITVMLETGTAGITFWEAVKRVRGRTDHSAELQVKDPQTNRTLERPDPAERTA